MTLVDLNKHEIAGKAKGILEYPFVFHPSTSALSRHLQLFDSAFEPLDTCKMVARRLIVLLCSNFQTVREGFEPSVAF